MGLGSTAKKVQQMADLAEKLYERLQRLREEVAATREMVDDTNQRVQSLESEVEAQRDVLEAVAEEQGIDVDALREEAERGGEDDA